MKPCPFCGDTPQQETWETANRAACRKCFAQGPIEFFYPKSSIVWNTRVSDPLAERLAEALRRCRGEDLRGERRREEALAAWDARKEEGR